MADYFSPTVVQPSIPLADMTALEQLLLEQVFDAEPDGDALYFYAEQSTSDMLWFDVGELREALAASQGIASEAATLIAAELERIDPHVEDLELDLSVKSWEFIFQDIIRRSAQISFVTAVSAFTCSKMRPDGFGGAVTVITADQVLSSSTEDITCDLLDRAEHGELGCAPGFGTHTLLRLAEADVRRTLDEIFETEAPPGLAIEDVTGTDIRDACLGVVAWTDLSHEVGEASFNAALAAIRLAAERRTGG